MALDRPIGPGFLTRYDWKSDIQRAHGFVECTDGILNYVVMLASFVRLRVIRQTKVETFKATVDRWIGQEPYSMAIAGCFATNAFKRTGWHIKVAKQFYDEGLVVENGSTLGESKPRRAFLATDGSNKISIGRGDPPPGTVHGFSGLGGVILKGVKFPTSLPGDEAMDSWFNAQFTRGLTCGNTLVALAEKENLLVALVKPNEVDPGLSLSAIRDRLSDAGFSDAVFLDGSDSVFLNVRGRWLLSQSEPKNGCTTIGLGFAYLPTA